jgi:hypothetical protein
MGEPCQHKSQNGDAIHLHDLQLTFSAINSNVEFSFCHALLDTRLRGKTSVILGITGDAVSRREGLIKQAWLSAFRTSFYSTQESRWGKPDPEQLRQWASSLPLRSLPV